MGIHSSANNLSHETHVLRVVLKALVLFAGFYLLLNSSPDITYFILKRLVLKVDKFPYYAVYYDSSSKNGLGLQNVLDVNSLFYSHVISEESKPANQYRIVFIGDSTVFNGQIYGMVDQQKCGGKILQAYNLGYPGISATKDLLILHDAMRYAPDLIVWSVTQEFSNNIRNFILANSVKTDELIKNYDYSVPGYNPSASEWPIFHRTDNVRLEIRLLLYYEILKPATGNGDDLLAAALSDKAKTRIHDSVLGRGEQLSSMLETLKKIVKDVPVLLINEPRPSNIIDQSQYVHYRSEMSGLSRNEHLTFLDLWGLVPDEYFGGENIHRDPRGEMLFDEAVMPAILEFACRQK